MNWSSCQYTKVCGNWYVHNWKPSINKSTENNMINTSNSNHNIIYTNNGNHNMNERKKQSWTQISIFPNIITISTTQIHILKHRAYRNQIIQRLSSIMEMYIIWTNIVLIIVIVQCRLLSQSWNENGQSVLLFPVHFMYTS